MTEAENPERKLPTSIAAADFSPDGKTLITASLEGILAEWDAETGQRLRVLVDPLGLEDENPRVVMTEDGNEVEPPFQLRRLSECMRGSSLLSIRFSPNGKYFVVGAANGTAVIWNASSRGELHAWRAHRADVVAVDFSPDGRWLATGALEEGGTTFRVWRLQESPVHLSEGIADGRLVGGVWAVCFSPDSRLVAEGGWTMSGYTAPQLFEVETGKHFGWLYWDMTRAMRFSPDGEFLVTGDEAGTVKLWRITEHMPTHELAAFKGIVTLVGFSPDGKRFCSGSFDGGVKVWETESGRLIGEYPISGRILAFRFGNDGNSLRVASAVKDADHPDIHKLD